MKKRIIIISALISFSFACAQVGVNTTSPKATFDITAKNPIGILSTAEGLLIPRVDRQKAQSMTGVVTSTLIYVNNVVSGTQTGTAVNIDAVGYYYFDSTVWTKISSGSSGKSTNIYTVNGNLTSNRTVSQTGRTLAFTGTAANAFSVDGSTLSINTATHAIGIGTTTPSNKMVVKGVNSQPSSTSATLRIDGSSNHALDIGTFADSPYGSYIYSHDKGTGSGLPLVLNPFGSSVGIGIINPSSSAVLDLFATNKGFLPPRLSTAQRDALNPKTAGLMVYNTTTHCMEHWDDSQWVSKCAIPTTIVLNCAGATNTGTLTSKTDVSGVSVSIPYTGGDGSAYTAQSVSSTGVTGLTATLAAGNFATGNGSLTYTITGTPSSDGIASFAINIGGQMCTITRNVASGAGTIITLDCAGATQNGTLNKGNAASGVSSVISYTGGDGSAYAAQAIPSTGVTGLTATLDAGNFANGNGSLTYTITGTPSSDGTASFDISIAGQTCTITRNVGQRTVVPPPSTGVTCEGWQIPLRQGNGTRSGTADGTSIIATVSGQLSTNSSSGVGFCVPAPSGPSPFAELKADGSHFTVQFNKKVSNLKVFILAINPGESTTFKLKRNGVVVTPTVNAIAGTCNGYLSITSNKVLNPETNTIAYSTVINIGNVWFDEIEFTRNIASHDSRTGGLVYDICVGSVQ